LKYYCCISFRNFGSAYVSMWLFSLWLLGVTFVFRFENNMKKYFAVFLFILLTTRLFSQSVSTAIVHVNVIAMTSPSLQSNMTVLITGNKIIDIGKTGEIKIPAHASVIDASGKYLIPGLWDMHVHVFAKRRQEEYDFPLFIANGVTGIREMWTKTEQMEQVKLWRNQFYERPGTIPRFVAVGTMIDGSPSTWPGSDTANTEADARLEVQRIKAAGVDFVKVYNRLSREAYFAIADEAKKQDIPFAGHVPFSILLREASDAGQRSIEHLTGHTMTDCATIAIEAKKTLPEVIATGSPDRPYIEQALELCDQKKSFALYQYLAKNGTWQVPTLILKKTITLDTTTLYGDKRLTYIPGGMVTFRGDYWRQYRKTAGEWDTLRMTLQRSLDVVGAMHRAGVNFMAGTDVGNPYIYPGFSLLDELEMFVEAGFTPFEALKTATINPAIFLGMTDSSGTIEKGKNADLVLLNANPLRNINNTKGVNAVIVNGRYLSRDVLNKMLADTEELAKNK
jgi:imidazolonepropionase-like amidohydrolase